MSGQLSEVTRIKQDFLHNTIFNETYRTEVICGVVRYEMDLWGNQTKLLYTDSSVVMKTQLGILLISMATLFICSATASKTIIGTIVDMLYEIVDE